MLPYRLRPPVYGKQLTKKKKQEQAANTGVQTAAAVDAGLFLGGGGPVQIAFEQDLLRHRDAFFLQQQQQQQTTNVGTTQAATEQQHEKEGTSFQVFRTVFCTAKIALLHSRFIPPRCDRSQYSQLLYAACLSLIQSAFLQKEADNNGILLLKHASYGLFCLYALYDTNPLPRGPSNNDTDKESFETLSMGLQDDENPKLLFRRSYRSPIRIDRFHYSLFVQLREEARAVQAQCQKGRMQALAKGLVERTTYSTVAATDEAAATATTTCPWSCHCGMATDAICILDRVMQHLNLCEYTGPCSVEGLAGHVDYPYPCREPNKQQQEERAACSLVAKQQWGRLSEAHLSEVLVGSTGTAESENYDLPETILADFQGYQSGLRALQIPADLTRQKTKRFQDTLAPVLQSTDVSLESLVAKALGISILDVASSPEKNAPRAATMTRRQLRSRRRVTWAEPDENDSTKNNGNNKSQKRTGTFHEKNIATAPTGVVQQDMAYELVLPVELPATLQEGIQKALEHILDRDQPFFFPTDGKAEVEANNNAAPSEERQDDVSSIGIGGVSLAQSSATGWGGAALKNLLAQATQSYGKDDDEVAARARMQIPTNKLQSGNDFLLMEEDDALSDNNNSAARGGDDDSDTSNLSASDLEEDAVSVATSAVGQRALATLLSKVSEKKKDSGRPRKAKSKTTTEKGNGSSSLRRKTNAGNRQQRNQAVEELSVASSRTGQGKAALDALLGLAESAAGHGPSPGEDGSDGKFCGNEEPSSDTEMDEGSIACSSVGQGRAAMQSFLTQVDQGKLKGKKATPRGRQNKRKAPGRMPGTWRAREMDDDSSQENSVLLGEEDVAAEMSAMTGQVAGNKQPSSDAEMDERSLAGSSVGPGRAAIQSLLAQVNQGKPKGTKAATRGRLINKETPQRKPAIRRAARAMDDDLSLENSVLLGDDEDVSTISVVSGQGKAALAALLSPVGEADEEGPTPPRKRRRKSKSSA